MQPVFVYLSVMSYLKLIIVVAVFYQSIKLGNIEKFKNQIFLKIKNEVCPLA